MSAWTAFAIGFVAGGWIEYGWIRINRRRRRERFMAGLLSADEIRDIEAQ